MKKDKLRLLPSLREKKRYLVILASGSKEAVKKKVEKAIMDFIGVFGYAQAGPIIIETGKTKKAKQSYAILSINRSFVDKAKAAFTFAKINCVGVSGSVKKVRRFL